MNFINITLGFPLEIPARTKKKAFQKWEAFFVFGWYELEVVAQ